MEPLIVYHITVRMFTTIENAMTVLDLMSD